MTSKEYLKQVRECDILIKVKEKQREKARQELVYLKGIDYSKDRVQTSPEDTLSNTVIRLATFDEELDKAIKDYQETIKEVTDTVMRLDNLDQADIIFKRYFDYKTFESIAVEMNMSYYRVCHIHGEALKALDEII